MIIALASKHLPNGVIEVGVDMEAVRRRSKPMPALLSALAYRGVPVVLDGDNIVATSGTLVQHPEEADQGVLFQWFPEGVPLP